MSAQRAASPEPRATLPRELGFRMPAEWEPHAATWLAWPFSKDWPGKLETVRWVFTEIARHLAASERVRLIVESSAAKRSVASWLSRAHVDLAQIDFFVARTDRTWTRDNLPSFVVDRDRAQLGAVKWRFNGWARYANHRHDERAGLAIAEATADLVWQPKVKLERRARRFVLEGGAIDVDGEGTLLTTRRCLLGSPHARNPGLGQAEVEAILGAHLDVERVIWLEDGISGDDTSGHVDDFARFVAPGVVVLSQEPNRADPNHAPLQRAHQALKRARDARGRKLTVVPLPMPGPVLHRGERLPASYANFYISNDSVLVPTFNDPNDRIALGVLAELFPKRTIRGIHALDLVLGLGTLHCSTQQEPALGLRSI